jgi:hypothetical protein
MPTYTKVRITTNTFGAGQIVACSELAIYADASRSTNLALTATLSASSELVAVTNANDGNTGTFWASASTTGPHWLQADLASASDIYEIRWRARSDASQSFTSALVELYDGSAWVSMGTWYTPQWYGDETKRFFPHDGTKKRFLRITPDVFGGPWTPSELQLRVVSGGVEQAALSCVDCTNLGGYDTYLIADGNTATFAACTGSGSFIVQLPPGVSYIGEVKITARNTSASSQSPSGITFSQSLTGDPNGAWTDSWSVSGLSWSDTETKTFTNPNPPPAGSSSNSASARVALGVHLGL